MQCTSTHILHVRRKLPTIQGKGAEGLFGKQKIIIVKLSSFINTHTYLHTVWYGTGTFTIIPAAGVWYCMIITMNDTFCVVLLNHIFPFD